MDTVIANSVIYSSGWSMSTKVTMAHLPHDPGDQAYIDYAGKSLHYTDLATGEIVPAAVLVVTLGHSQFTFVRAKPRPDYRVVHTWADTGPGVL